MYTSYIRGGQGATNNVVNQQQMPANLYQRPSSSPNQQRQRQTQRRQRPLSAGSRSRRVLDEGTAATTGIALGLRQSSSDQQPYPAMQARLSHRNTSISGKKSGGSEIGANSSLVGRSPKSSGRQRDSIAGSNFKVVIRVRPPLQRELAAGTFKNVVRLSSSDGISLSENFEAQDSYGNQLHACHTFTFDHVYEMQATQKGVYETTAQAVVASALEGYNATIFAYGQTGTGKTYTMEGFDSAGGRGIIPRAIEQIFHHIQGSASPTLRFLVRCSYLQIYNEVISDLLKPELSNLLIREDKKRGVFVEGLSEWVVRSPQEIYGLMERGGLVRATGSHKLNELSSRSHAVFIIICEQSESCYVDANGNPISISEYERQVRDYEMATAQLDPSVRKSNVNHHGPRLQQSFRVGKLNLVDLAGSERVRMTGATGQRLEETKKINQSLSALGNVIAALTDPKGRRHIPYRDSKLTRILEDSLGGNCKTTMMAMISPALEAFSESLSTLKFANRAKNIKNEARVNEDMDQLSLLRKYERELKQLRAELKTRNQNVVDKRQLLEVDEQRRRAEQDKLTALRALEARSIEMMKEKSEKRKLEHRISALSSQMLAGGSIDAHGNPIPGSLKIEVLQQTPAFRNAVAAQQSQIRAQYEDKLADLEQERHSIEQEKEEQVGRSKELLQKQRNIMVALTERLNERDERIVELQEELDAYDRRQKELEERLDEKTAQLIHLQRVTVEHNESSPYKSRVLEKAALGRDHWLDRIDNNPMDNDKDIFMDDVRDGKSRHSMVDGVVIDTTDQLSDSQSLAGDEEVLRRRLRETLVEKAELENMLQVYMGERGQASPRSNLFSGMSSKLRQPQEIIDKELREAQRHKEQMSADYRAYRDQAEAKLREQEQQIQQLRDQQIKKEQQQQQQITELQHKLRMATASSPVSVAAQEASLLRERCATHVKERRAVLTIMEQKIKKLVANAGKEARNILVPAATDPVNASTHTDPLAPVPLLETSVGLRLSRELKTLSRLVNASIAALKNSSRES